ncbi:hypothetical protein AWM75_02025 [Aerococcus urinaehominis]|uniref:UvrD-like helicase C-terminal domain-containing protein n=1 Tax=Aerococcus urinaehominis TaxID=128944 RepID=A0A120IAR1_9LACT|nr:PD-(D/E)XK nuclease family protein [Aerococcus urinaehominis]AMB98843.1 hypothetical protein AWM75_02025 [Aerococcus urinaehominis]SDM17543.1 DNA helicase/exodeoxyribonuclease V, subunit B [Aerococcus urinaehominis]
MALQFFNTRLTHQDKTSLYQAIDQHLAASPDHQVFYLVPNHMKFDMELEVFQAMKQVRQTAAYHPANSGGMRLQVFSFQRLAWYLRPADQAQLSTSLSQIAVVMLLAKVLGQLADDLVIFRGEVNNIGFINQLAELFKEFQEGNISGSDLAGLTTDLADHVQGDLLKTKQVDKLNELAKIYQAYDRAMADQAYSQTLIYDQLDQAISQVDLGKTMVVIDGFINLNRRELQIVQALIAAAGEVVVCLELDQTYRQNLPDSGHIYRYSGEIYYQLYQFAQAHQITIRSDAYGQVSQQLSTGLANMVSYFENNQQVVSESEKASVREAYQVWMCESTYIESEQVANKIYNLVAKAGYRYQDILILTRDMDHYRQQLLPQLQRQGIPYFVDDEETMAGHPLYRFLKALYRIYRYNWRYQDIFDLLRSELLLPKTHDQEAMDLPSFRRQVDLTENVVLKYGYEGKKWWRPQAQWRYLRVDENGEKIGSQTDQAVEKIANEVKSFVAGSLEALFDKLDQAEDNRAAMTVLYQFLNQAGVVDQLFSWRDQLLDQSQLEQARHHEQAWQSLVDLLDDYVTLFADQTFDMDVFFEILQLAMNQATYAIVPPSLDAVTITGMDSQRVQKAKVSFVIGLTDQVLPKNYQNRSLLNLEDRDLVGQVLAPDQALAPNELDLRANENFVAFKAFTSASQQVFLTVPYNSLSASSGQPSPYIDRLCQAFALSAVFKRHNQINLTSRDALSLGNYQSQIYHLLMKIRQAFDEGRILDKFWLQLYQDLLADTDLLPIFKPLLKSLTFHNRVENLEPSLAQDLYGKDFSASVSRLEMYNRDPFSYFLVHGLKLKERELFTLDARETGNYYHDAIEHFFQLANQAQLKISQLDAKQFDQLFRQTSQDLLNEDQYPSYHIFKVNNRHKYRQQRLDHSLYQTLRELVNQYRLSHLENYKNELSFGFVNADISQPLNLRTSDGHNINLRGRIDRLDCLPEAGKTYIQIVDYKSSAHKVDFSQIYSGTSLQLYTYLLVALAYFNKQADQPALPLGAFYEEVKSPLIKVTNQATFEANRDQQYLESYRLEGYVLADAGLISQADQHFAREDRSLIYPAQLTKQGNFHQGRSKVVSLADFQTILDFTQAKIITTVEQMMSGDISLQPLEEDPYVPSIREPYRAVSFFDASDYLNHYRPLEKMTKEQFFQRLKADQAEDDEEEANHDQDA